MIPRCDAEDTCTLDRRCPHVRRCRELVAADDYGITPVRHVFESARKPAAESPD